MGGNMNYPKICITMLLLLTACAQKSVIPLSADTAEINVSAGAVVGRAGVVKIALQQAAQYTVDAGFDKFIVVNDTAWNEMHAAGFGQSSFNATPYAANGQATSGFSTIGRPEARMIIKLFHANDRGAEKAIDARGVLKQQATN